MASVYVYSTMMSEPSQRATESFPFSTFPSMNMPSFNWNFKQFSSSDDAAITSFLDHSLQQIE